MFELWIQLSLIEMEGNPHKTHTKLYPSFATRFTTTWGWSTSNTPYCACDALPYANYAQCIETVKPTQPHYSTRSSLSKQFRVFNSLRCRVASLSTSSVHVTYTHITNTSHLHIRAPRTYHYVSPTTTPLVIQQITYDSAFICFYRELKEIDTPHNAPQRSHNVSTTKGNVIYLPNEETACEGLRPIPAHTFSLHIHHTYTQTSTKVYFFTSILSYLISYIIHLLYYYNTFLLQRAKALQSHIFS